MNDLNKTVQVDEVDVNYNLNTTNSCTLKNNNHPYSKKVLVSERRLLGAVSKWAVEQSPYHRPDNLEVVLDKLHSLTKNEFSKWRLGYMEFTDHRSTITFVRDNLRQIPEYVAWNERKNGNQSAYQFVSRYDSYIDPDNDFIDLDALEGNVTAELESEY